MELFWNGKNITEYVIITGCVLCDAAGKADSIEIMFDHASVWYRWAPQFNDEIEITHNGVSSGRMYLTAVIPAGDQYRILATSINQKAQRNAWGSYRNTSLQSVSALIASECDMQAKLYGLDGNLDYPYLLRKNEGCASFLKKIASWEGAVVKSYNNTFRIISVQWAQAREPVQIIEINSKQQGITYKRRDGYRYTGITIASPYAESSANDVNADGNIFMLTGFPAKNPSQAGRWARGLLLMHNRKFEELTIEQSLNTDMTSMVRIDVSGDTDASGKWIVDEAEHDFINKRTVTHLYRVIDSIK